MSRLSLNSVSTLLTVVTLAAMTCANGQARAADPFIGEVTAANVNLRSGPSTNYYVVARLAAGARITVAGEENDWYAIIPTPDCYSLISAHYVDVGAEGEGVINGDSVRVRAGSDLDSHRYAVQLKLNKGAEVQVLGDGADGFLKIAPPRGAYVWIHTDYVARVPQEILDLEAQRASPQDRVNAAAPPAVEPAAQPQETTGRTEEIGAQPPAPTGDGTVSVTKATFARGAEKEQEPPAHTPPSVYRAQLQAADEAMRAEMAKPIVDRLIDDVADPYERIAAQEEDTFARLYAQRRILQLQNAAHTVEAVRRVRGLSDEVSRERKRALAARSNIRPSVRSFVRGFDAKGELRRSMIYTSPAGPHRYRLVDPALDVPRTLCYVEIPRDLHLDVGAYLGRLVGVRASEKYLETGDVNPIPIVVAEELVVLDEPAEANEDTVEIDLGEEPAPQEIETVATAAGIDTPA